MAMVSCPKCGAQISSEAPSCPRCGDVRQRDGGDMASKIIVLLGHTVAIAIIVLPNLR